MRDSVGGGPLREKCEITPITLREARLFVDRYHRHHKAPQGGLFAIGLSTGTDVIGVVIIGRPVSRHMDDGYTAEVTRLCVLEGNRNACSTLYSASWRAARGMGYRKLITYTLNTEPGTSLTARGWDIVAETGGGSWSREFRPRVDEHPLQGKIKWQVSPDAEKRT